MNVPEPSWHWMQPREPDDAEAELLRAHGGEWPDREDVGPWDRLEEEAGER